MEEASADIQHAVELDPLYVLMHRCVHASDLRQTMFVAGKDVFLLIPSTGPTVPSDVPIMVEGILNDQTNPMELRVLTVKPIAGE